MNVRAQIKKFIKERCKSPEDSRLLKQALDKIDENVKFIEQRRKNVAFKFNTTNEVVSDARVPASCPM